MRGCLNNGDTTHPPLGSEGRGIKDNFDLPASVLKRVTALTERTSEIPCCPVGRRRAQGGDWSKERSDAISSVHVHFPTLCQPSRRRVERSQGS